MADQMRQALGKVKDYYIRKLIELDVYKPSDPQLQKLTLTEMAALYKKYSK
jgi:hypothetical protein